MVHNSTGSATNSIISTDSAPAFIPSPDRPLIGSDSHYDLVFTSRWDQWRFNTSRQLSKWARPDNVLLLVVVLITVITGMLACLLVCLCRPTRSIEWLIALPRIVSYRITLMCLMDVLSSLPMNLLLLFATCFDPVQALPTTYSSTRLAFAWRTTPSFLPSLPRSSVSRSTG
jgi:hypothetical protein